MIYTNQLLQFLLALLAIFFLPILVGWIFFVVTENWNYFGAGALLVWGFQAIALIFWIFYNEGIHKRSP